MVKLTLEQLIELKGSKHAAKKWIWKTSRLLYLQSDRPKFCIRCGCPDCFEVDHIKPISHFNTTDIVDEIIQLDNLQALCPTCHAVKTSFDVQKILHPDRDTVSLVS